MKIEKNTVVSISYELEAINEKGEVKVTEKTGKDQPMVILYGNSGLPDKFEEGINGLTLGETFALKIDSEDAYGPLDPEAVVDLSKDIFKVEGAFDEGQFKVGTLVPMSDQEGNLFKGKVLEVKSDTLKIDFNHPLAGLDLYFKGEILEVRKATDDEIAHGHAHGPGGHHHH